jgi:hypothetical protein
LNDLLPHFYSNFQKDFIASLTAKLAAGLCLPLYIHLNSLKHCFSFQVANEISVVKRIFEDAGFMLAHHLMAISPKVDKVRSFESIYRL